MANKNRYIVIEFDKEIIEDPVGNQAAFTVTGKEYLHVGGPLVTKTYPVIATSRPMQVMQRCMQTASPEALDKIEVYDGAITLAQRP